MHTVFLWQALDHCILTIPNFTDQWEHKITDIPNGLGGWPSPLENQESWSWWFWWCQVFLENQQNLVIRETGKSRKLARFFWHMKPGYHYFHSQAAIKDKTTLNRFHSIKWCKDHWILVDLTKSIYKLCWFFFFAKIKCKYQLFKREHQIKTAAQD